MPYKRRYRRRTRRPLRKTIYRRRTFRKRRLASYIKKVARGTAETKFITYANNSATVPFNQFRVWNLVRQIPSGTSQNNIIGEQYFIKGFRLRIQFSNFSGGVTTSAQSEIITALIWTKEPITATTAIFAASGFQIADNGVVTIDRWNTDDFKVIKQWRHRITPQYSGQNIDKVFKAYVPINRTFRQESSTSAFGKSGTYYLFSGLWVPGGVSGTTILQGAFNTTMYFKDP